MVAGGSMRDATSKAITATGMLNRKIACHPNACVSTPPITGPEAAPTPSTEPINPNVRPCCSDGVIARSNDCTFGPSAAANTACATRAATSSANVLAAAARAENTISPTRAMLTVRRLPIASPNRPASG